MSPKNARAIIGVLLCVSALSVSCAKRQAAVVPPPTPPAAETPPTPAPPPAPAPSQEPGESTQIGSSDLVPAFFDLDSYALRDDARTALDRDAKLLRDNPNVRIVIEGHADERGTVEYNQALGERRSQSARDYLVAAGIAPTRIEIITYGKERPFAPGHDESAWQQNRRAHLVVRSSS